MNAKDQYDVVRELRDKVLQYDPHAVIAGGAVRDWYIGQPAQDVDFFLNIAQGRSVSWNYELLENILGLGKLTPVGKEYFEIKEEVAEDDDKDATYPTWWWRSEREFMSCIEGSAQWSFYPVDDFEGNV